MDKINKLNKKIKQKKVTNLFKNHKKWNGI